MASEEIEAQRYRQLIVLAQGELGSRDAAILTKVHAWAAERDEDQRDPWLERPLDRPLAQTGLSTRMVNLLEDRLGVFTVGDLAERTEAELLELRSLGEKGFREWRQVVEAAVAQLRRNRQARK